jgi:hypothetical protein
MLPDWFSLLQQGILIPKISDADRLVMDPVRWVLVIEKEVN